MSIRHIEGLELKEKPGYSRGPCVLCGYQGCRCEARPERHPRGSSTLVGGKIKMSKPDITGQTTTIGALHFHSPTRLTQPSRAGSCWCCSHRLKKVYIQAICQEDNQPRNMHVVCWDSNRDDKPGWYKVAEARKEASREYELKQVAKQIRE